MRPPWPGCAVGYPADHDRAGEGRFRRARRAGVRLAELVAALGLAIDLGMDQPIGQGCGPACEVAQLLTDRMGFGAGLREDLGLFYEHWDGRGRPGRAASEQLTVPVRVVQVAEVADLYWRVGGLAAAGGSSPPPPSCWPTRPVGTASSTRAFLARARATTARTVKLCQPLARGRDELAVGGRLLPDVRQMLCSSRPPVSSLSAAIPYAA